MTRHKHWLNDKTIEALTSVDASGATPDELRHMMGDDAPSRRELRTTLRRLARQGRILRLAKDVFAPLPADLAAEVEDEQPKKSTRIPAKRAYRVVETGERNATVLLDQLAEGMGVDRPFPKAAIEESAVGVAPEDPVGDDLTHLPFVTIDGADAKDFDDAVFAEPVSGGTRLWVAVADVSHYVTPGSVLDAEALSRGSSVYIPGRVYPMLPSHLSDGVCSLRPNELRRCAWVRMDLDDFGDVFDYDVGFGTLRSRARLTYVEVQAFLDEGDILVDQDVSQSLRLLDAVRGRLYAKRRRRGMLDLDLPEPQIALTEDGASVEMVEPSPRLRAHRLIEECMLATNETVADYLASEGWPSVLRVHGTPSDDRLVRFHSVAHALGVDVELPDDPDVDDLTELISSFEGHPEAWTLSTALLRSLPPAQYSTEDMGHYGIGARRYLHFTSPIRRYPDLENHRLVRRSLTEKPPKGAQRGRLDERLQKVAEASNEGEDRATQAERYADRLLGALHMADRVGETFEGIVSGVTDFGVFVTIRSPFVDGLVPISTLHDDYYELDVEEQRLVGRRHGRKLTVGDRVKVRCDRVVVADAKVDFLMVEVVDSGSRRAPKPSSPRKSNRRGGSGRKGGRRRGKKRR